MNSALIDHAIELLEKANAELQPELLPAPAARALLASYARARRLVDYGIAGPSRKVDDASQLARVTGTSIGRARAVVSTGKVLATSNDLSAALEHGDISLDQAAEIATAEESAGAARELVAVAQREPFHVLKDRARKAKLDAEQHRNLGARQRAARYARSHSDELGMVRIDLALEPTPERRSSPAPRPRLPGWRARRAPNRRMDQPSRSSAFSPMRTRCLSGSAKGRARRPELVVLVSHEVAKRGWTDVRDAELCTIPGVGPVSPQVAKEIARDAFLSGVFYDGVDLRNFARWSRHIPIEVAIALELGEPPEFDGVCCVDCGNRFKTEFDHVEPHVAHGPASNGNLTPRCWRCHRAKTKRDRTAGRLRPPEH
jgi:hypothetical protein